MPAQLSTRPGPPNPHDYSSESAFRHDYRGYQQMYGGPNIDGLYSRDEIARALGFGGREMYGRSMADYHNMVCPPIVMDVMAASEIHARRAQKDSLPAPSKAPSKAPCMNRKLLLTKR